MLIIIGALAAGYLSGESETKIKREVEQRIAASLSLRDMATGVTYSCYPNSRQKKEVAK